MSEYLPEFLTVEEACSYLGESTGSRWTLPQLLGVCPMPWVWLDYSPGLPKAIFGDRIEGYLAPLCFAGDVARLKGKSTDGLLTMTRTPEGALFRMEPGCRFPLSELRFRRDEVLRAAGKSNGGESATTQTAATGNADDELAALFDPLPVATRKHVPRRWAMGAMGRARQG